jgi:hypothetical protein
MGRTPPFVRGYGIGTRGSTHDTPEKLSDLTGYTQNDNVCTTNKEEKLARKSLLTGLSNKAEQLRSIQEKQKQAAVNFIEASRKAEETAVIADQHAAAVEQALTIITKAGVQL